jgi:3-methylcrotonyl-CoA carboxylase alpha subunit
MEARLYAENPVTGFLPSTGSLDRLRFPSGIRIDSGVEQGGEVTPYYDPMIAKLIVAAPTRGAAAAKLATACGALQVWPVKTNAAFLARAAADPAFVAGDIDTGFIERHLERLVPGGHPSNEVLQGAAVALLPAGSSDPWTALPGFRSASEPDHRVAVDIAGHVHLVALTGASASGVVESVKGETLLFLSGEVWPFGPPVADHVAGGSGQSDGAILAPMPGRIVSVDVTADEAVVAGQRLLVLEAMKMEQALLAPFDGTVAELSAEAGGQVAEGTVLARIEKEAEKAS